MVAGLTCLAGLSMSAAARAEFGISAFDGQSLANAAGDPYTQAGGHPFALTTSIALRSSTDPVFGTSWPDEPLKDLSVDLPPGLVGNPNAAAKCTFGQLMTWFQAPGSPGQGTSCPAGSQVGTTTLTFNVGAPPPFDVTTSTPQPVYNMVPAPGSPASFAFIVAGVVVVLDAQPRTDSDYGLTVRVRNVSQALPVLATTLTFWGVPADQAHDGDRFCPGFSTPGCATDAEPTAFLTAPTACTPAGTGLTTTVRASSWAQPSVVAHDSFISHLPPGYPDPPSAWGPPQGPTGCDAVPFDPVLTAQPASDRASVPAAWKFDLRMPQDEAPDGLAQAHLKRAVVRLPEGVRVSPSSAGGLDGCTEAQIAIGRSSTGGCPDASKLGTARIDTPLLDEALTGAIYLAKPHTNRFGTLLALYVEVTGAGVTVKLPGRIESDPATGRVTATFDDNPQLPFDRLQLDFFGGERAALSNPPGCGTYRTTAELTSWSGRTVNSASEFSIVSGPEGEPCGPRPCAPYFSAGTLAQLPAAGGSAPFELTVARSDADQEFRTVAVTLPPGLLARIAAVDDLCPDVAAATGTCSERSRIGSLTTTAGPGASPFTVDGRVYLTGPYRGQPYGLSMVVPVVAGPFDLGTVVVRASIAIDRSTAVARIVADPLPTILQGIPLQLRTIAVRIDRPGFIVHPTSCSARRVEGELRSVDGAAAAVGTRFQAGECGSLRYGPRMSLQIGARGRTRVGATTPLRATLTMPSGNAANRVVRVSLPRALNARLDPIRAACTLDEYRSDSTRCRRVGTATAVTPLLADPLSGGAYFVRNPARRVPDLMVRLVGSERSALVAFDLVGKVTIPANLSLRTTFDTIPDVPLSRFVLSLRAGRSGPIGIVEKVCGKVRSSVLGAGLEFRAHDGARIVRRQRMRVVGCARSRSAQARPRARR
jgi:hypothetical protein